MRDLSLHIMDLVQNSISAGATLVSICLTVDCNQWITLSITDDGKGMSDQLVQKVLDPFYTTRTTRKVGIGIPLMAQNARLTGGDISINSLEGKGTTLIARLNGNSIDCLPIGSLSDTLSALIASNPFSPDFVLQCRTPDGEFDFDTRDIRMVLQDVPLNTPEVLNYVSNIISNETKDLFGGAQA